MALVVVGWGSSAGAWSTGAGGDPNWGSTTFGGTNSDRAYGGVAVDGSGNVYTTGAFSGTVDFGAGNVTAAGNFDVFVTKLNSSGVHQWTTTFGGTSIAFGFGVAVDGSGNVHVTGYFDGTVDFSAGDVASAGDYDAFVTKLNSSGSHQWTTTFGGTGDDFGESVAVDGSGNVHVGGYFEGTVNFGAGNVTSAGNQDVFVTKLNSSGVHQWTTTLGGTGTELAREVAVDGPGNVHVTGLFNGTVDFGAGDVTSAGNSDVFVTKLNSSGAHQWTTTFGGTSYDFGWGVAVDGSSNVYSTGYFEGTVDFGAGNVTSAGSYDVFVVKLNSAGQAVVAPSDDDDDDGGTPAPPPPAPCPWPTAAYAYQPGCVEPLKGGISVDADGTLFTVGNLDVTGVTIDLEDGETATDIELVSGGTTTGYVLTSKQRIIGFGDTPTTDEAGKDLVTLWPGETVTQLSNNRNGTYFATSHGRVFDTNGNPYVDLSRYITTNNIVDIKTTDSGSGILIGADGAVFSFGLDLFQGSLGGQGVTDIIGGHLVPGGYYLLSATGTIHTFGDIEIAPDITTATAESFDTDTLNAHIIDVTPAGTGLCALGADGGLFDMLGAQHNTVLRAHTNPNTTAIDTTG